MSSQEFHDKPSRNTTNVHMNYFGTVHVSHSLLKESVDTCDSITLCTVLAARQNILLATA